MSTDELRDIANTLQDCSKRLGVVVDGIPDKARDLKLPGAHWAVRAASSLILRAAVALEEHAVPGEGEV